MATSGSKDWTLARDEIVDGAIRMLGNNAGGKLGLDSQRTEASEALNMIVKAWQAEGIGLWMNTNCALFLENSGESYSLGSTGDHSTSTWVKTEVSTAASSGDSTVVVDSITGMTDEDYVGIELDDDTIQWTTIDGTPSSLTITLDDVLTDDVAVNNHIYTYTTKISRPIEITEARLRRDDGQEIPLTVVSRDEYMNLPDKDSTGTAVQYYYDTQIGNGVFYVWPVATDMKEYIVYTARVPMDDFDAAANNAQLPNETLRALKWALADELTLEYETDLQKVHIIHARAAEAKVQLMDVDKEYASVYFTPY